MLTHDDWRRRSELWVEILGNRQWIIRRNINNTISSNINNNNHRQRQQLKCRPITHMIINRSNTNITLLKITPQRLIHNNFTKNPPPLILPVSQSHPTRPIFLITIMPISPLELELELNSHPIWRCFLGLPPRHRGACDRRWSIRVLQAKAMFDLFFPFCFLIFPFSIVIAFKGICNQVLLICSFKI